MIIKKRVCARCGIKYQNRSRKYCNKCQYIVRKSRDGKINFSKQEVKQNEQN